MLDKIDRSLDKIDKIDSFELKIITKFEFNRFLTYKDRLIMSEFEFDNLLTLKMAFDTQTWV